jgi:hypothetical protein
MANDVPALQSDKEVYESGAPVLLYHSVTPGRMEEWVRKIAVQTGQRIDWHYFGGRIVVKAMGDIELVKKTIDANMTELVALQEASLAESAA